MQAIFLLLLFILQLISFYIIALLFMKVSKFNDLEKKQQKLMAEMDDAIGLYLTELKEENERLIDIIEKRPMNNESNKQKKPVQESVESVEQDDSRNDSFTINQLKYPVKVAMKSYQTAMPIANKNSEESIIAEEKMDNRSIAIRMHDDGKTIEEIAKTLGKGKTEIELLLKFR